ncbi:LemA family protein [Roseisolibacter sp. H3M3-2]|uniref:LemA family protein n=1 Tax=Roseisolibacter sp. H3M3-2 TaxID=3031323 RepID=UPI0023DC761F|nr:LemA family protein [Roseisolibacter sp. H3M3-2]MDF1504176.1 LemA family protein [Roseisolibacter sp. H3M3-2]
MRDRIPPRPLTRRALAVALAVGLALGPTGCGYNRIQTLDEQAAQAKQQIEVQLQRRADLIPNLVATVKGYAQQEETIFTRVAEAQRGLTGALARPGGGDPTELANANENLSRALVPMLTLVQAYPQLQSNQQFLRLQDELTGTENRIATARTDYNGAVREYNTLIRTFPTALTAKVTGAQQRTYFEVTDAAARSAPTVDFSRPDAAGAAAPASTPATPATPAPR